MYGYNQSGETPVDCVCSTCPVVLMSYLMVCHFLVGFELLEVTACGCVNTIFLGFFLSVKYVLIVDFVTIRIQPPPPIGPPKLNSWVVCYRTQVSP